MSKIRLQLDSLAVDSFETGAALAAAGTVRARQGETVPVPSAPDSCLPPTLVTCARAQSNEYSCYYRCECTDRFRLCIGPQPPNTLDC